MLKIDYNRDNKQFIVECSGTQSEILAEMAAVVGHIYAGIRSNDPDMAARFSGAVLSRWYPLRIAPCGNVRPIWTTGATAS